MNNIALDLGIIKIHWYSLTMLTAMVVGGILFINECKKKSINKEIIENMLFYTIIFGILGARIYYVIFNLSYYLSNPIEIIEIWNGGLAIHGGLIGGVLTILYHCKKHNISFLSILDNASFPVIISQAIGRWGNFFNQEAHGPVTTFATLKSLYIPDFIIKGMKIGGLYYHPTFYYECIWNILGFIVLITINKYKKNLKKGTLTGIYLMWYSSARFFIESLRTDSLMLFNLKIAQIVSIILFLIGVYLVFIRKDKKQSKEE